MKTLVIVATFLMFCLEPPAFAEQTGAAQGPDGVASISFADAVFNFGTVTEGLVVDHSFGFENKGSSPLKIEKIKTTCGCTSGEYTREEIPPGGQGSVILQFDSDGYSGKSVKKCAYVYTDIPGSEPLSICLVGDVAAFAAIDPKSIKLFGSPEEKIEATVEIKPLKASGFHIIGEPQTGKDDYRCTLEEKDGKYILRAENLSKRSKIYFDTVVLRTDDPEIPEIKISVVGKIKAKVP